MKRYNPVGDRLLVIPCKPPEKSGSIWLPNTAKHEDVEAVVIAKGKGTKQMPMDDIHLRDRILISATAGENVTYPDENGDPKEGTMIRYHEIKVKIC